MRVVLLGRRDDVRGQLDGELGGGLEGARGPDQREDPDRAVPAGRGDMPLDLPDGVGQGDLGRSQDRQLGGGDGLGRLGDRRL